MLEKCASGPKESLWVWGKWGRPVGNTADKGFSSSGGRPVYTTADKEFGTIGGRPVGTTADKKF